jgi:hypothetical protein
MGERDRDDLPSNVKPRPFGEQPPGSPGPGPDQTDQPDPGDPNESAPGGPADAPDQDAQGRVEPQPSGPIEPGPGGLFGEVEPGSGELFGDNQIRVPNPPDVEGAPQLPPSEVLSRPGDIADPGVETQVEQPKLSPAEVLRPKPAPAFEWPPAGADAGPGETSDHPISFEAPGPVDSSETHGGIHLPGHGSGDSPPGDVLPGGGQGPSPRPWAPRDGLTFPGQSPGPGSSSYDSPMPPVHVDVKFGDGEPGARPGLSSTCERCGAVTEFGLALCKDCLRKLPGHK